jgi:hypothetical protein
MALHSAAERTSYRRFGIALTASFTILASAAVCNGQGLVVVDKAILESQVMLASGRQVGACGIRVRAPHSIGLQAVRTWDMTLYIARRGNAGIAIDATSYDTDKPGAKPEVRPAPTELSFTVTGNVRTFTAVRFRAAQTQGESLALISEKGAGQILTAFRAGTPVVVFFRPGGAETETIVVSGKSTLRTVDTFGQCIQYLEGAETGAPWPKNEPSSEAPAALQGK